MQIPNDIITKIGAGGTMIAGIAGLLTGTVSIEAAVGLISGALAVFGLGRKMERTALSSAQTAQTAVKTQATVESAVVVVEEAAATAEEAQAKVLELAEQNRLFLLRPKKH